MKIVIICNNGQLEIEDQISRRQGAQVVIFKNESIPQLKMQFKCDKYNWQNTVKAGYSICLDCPPPLNIQSLVWKNVSVQRLQYFFFSHRLSETLLSEVLSFLCVEWQVGANVCNLDSGHFLIKLTNVSAQSRTFRHAYCYGYRISFGDLLFSPTRGRYAFTSRARSCWFRAVFGTSSSVCQ